MTNNNRNWIWFVYWFFDNLSYWNWEGRWDWAINWNGVGVLDRYWDGHRPGNWNWSINRYRNWMGYWNWMRNWIWSVNWIWMWRQNHSY